MAEPLDPEALFHLATPTEWEHYEQHGLIEPPSLPSEGFVHCSWGRQVPSTLDRHFAEVTELFALRLDRAALVSPGITEEDTTGSGQLFPHVYGAIPVTAVEEVIPVRSAAQP